MSRRCVVCGKEFASDAIDSACHYPKNQKEAQIWQKSLGTFASSVESIAKYCCVCIEHIPQFVERTQKEASLIKDQCNQKNWKTPPLNRPSLQVLLLSGATLSPCFDTSKSGDNDQKEDSLDEEIFVRESEYKDCGLPMLNIEDTKVKTSQECGDIGSLCNCTDVLLLGRSQPVTHPCKCEACSPKPHIQNVDQCSSVECKCQMRLQMGGIIQKQQQRISELETMLCRQNEWYMTLQHKMNELYADFGRLGHIDTFNDNQNQHPSQKQLSSKAESEHTIASNRQGCRCPTNNMQPK
ncbi:uncharacterized protein LOC111602988 [Drosophila hydei]|uniref:Uncharacterized protein LOC111602988 n=1 Tax=Drosophila hydei TaxID=7224 RepID=A0A6J1M7L8_DROHY|nr:uncharacterized protein LOC111602988 [Drosophila hydei]